MLKLKKRTKAEYCQDIVNKYVKATNKDEWDLMEVARWAIKQNLWESSPANALKQCAHDLARALRNEYFTDPQRRRVRKKHAFKTLQGWLWSDIELIKPERMHLSLQQRRGYIVGDCKQLKTDLDSYNDNNPHGAQIQMSFNFTEDLHELAMPSTYPDSKPK
jgi:hypothetical protein